MFLWSLDVDEQLTRSAMGELIPNEVIDVRVTRLEAHGIFGVLVLAESAHQEMQLVPLHPGGLSPHIQVGDLGLALLVNGDPHQGYYLSGALISGQLPDGWANGSTRLHARALLELTGVSGVAIQGGGAAAARVGDAVKVSIASGATLQALAVALLATGAFTPTGSAPAPTPPVDPIDLSGSITEGSEEVSIG